MMNLFLIIFIFKIILCSFFEEHFNPKEILKINLKSKSKEIPYIHNIRFFIDYNLINEEFNLNMINFKKSINEIFFLLNQLILVRNNKIIDIPNNLTIFNKKNIVQKIDADFVLIPNKNIKFIYGVDESNNRPIFVITDFSFLSNKNIEDMKKELIIFIFHCLGINKFHNSNIIIKKKLLKKLNRLIKYISNIDVRKNIFENKESSRFRRKLQFSNDIMVINSTFSNTITEISLIYLSDLDYYEIKTCDIMLYQGKCYNFKNCIFHSKKTKILIAYETDGKNIFCYNNLNKKIKDKICPSFYVKLINNDLIGFCPNYELSYLSNAHYNDYYKSPEFFLVKYQNISLLTQGEKCPHKHSRTLWLYNPITIGMFKNNQSHFNIENITLTDNNYFFSITYEHNNVYLGKSIQTILNFNNIIKSFGEIQNNIIVDHIKFSGYDNIVERIKKINKYQHFSYFPFFKKIQIKTELHKLFKNYQKKFPDDYNFMAETYIYPEEKDLIMNKFKNYKLNKSNLYFVKPPDLYSGRGIFFLKNLSNIKYNKYIITKYINSFLVYKKKFDLRIYVLITGICPLKIYLNIDGLVRIAASNYSLDNLDLSSHLTGITTNQKKKSFKKNNNYFSEDGNDWSLFVFKNYYERQGKNYTLLWTKIKDIVIKSFIFLTEDPINYEKYIKEKKLHQIWGLDILVDSNGIPWLLEMNGNNPMLNSIDKMDLVVKSELMKDMWNIIGVEPYSHVKEPKLLDDVFIYSNLTEELVDRSLCEFERAKGSRLERIFPIKDNIEYYKKFIKKPSNEDFLLWRKIIEKNY